VDHFPHKSFGDSRYFITFTYDFNKKSWIYFFVTKSQAFEKFKFFKELVEKSEGKIIKMLRIDRGGEFLSNAFNAFCDLYRIQRQFTITHMHQNGVAERKNHIIV
jgi:hypothetical protein